MLQHTEQIQKALLAWYKKEGRKNLPWRHTTDLYKITVAEIMLQQTNVPKVIERYINFLQLFPTWQKLAEAGTGTVLRAWQGLGYNRRALYLHRMAKEVTEKYNGALPENTETLRTLPGMGPYTRAAVLVFGRNADLSAVDVNIARVIRRLHGAHTWDAEKTQRETAGMVPQGNSRDWHNGLMDFAGMVCTKKAPNCIHCPLAKLCKSYPVPQDEQKIKRKEPGRTEHGKHIPRRIFRGRVVECLRQKPASLITLGKVIKKDWNTQKDTLWLTEILEKLSTEGMVEYAARQWRLKA